MTQRWLGNVFRIDLKKEVRRHKEELGYKTVFTGPVKCGRSMLPLPMLKEYDLMVGLYTNDPPREVVEQVEKTMRRMRRAGLSGILTEGK